MLIDRLRRHVGLRTPTFVLSLVLFAWLIWYFYTGLGGPLELVARLLSIALIVQILFMYQQDYLYRRLPPALNHALVTLYVGIAAYAFWYFWGEYERIAIYAQGTYTQHDYVVGLLMFLLVMELTRLAHPILFWVNLVMVVYTLYGYLFPRWLDFFWHPGTTFHRVVTSSTVEYSTGIYGPYAQLALTLVAAFLLLAAAARGFDAQNAMVGVMRRLAGRSRHMVPQTAVLASVSVGMISGSGSANTAVTGSFTIPFRHLRPLRHGGEDGLGADRRHAAGGDRDLRHHLRHLRAVHRDRRRQRPPAGGAGAGLVRGDAAPGRHHRDGGRRAGAAGRRLRRGAPPAHRAAQARHPTVAAGGLTIVTDAGSSPRPPRGWPRTPAPS
ncbi:MAG TPA: TRAP transporter large permease subunit [Methylomirabilota bacterium]